jgi:hypothetical protein
MKVGAGCRVVAEISLLRPSSYSSSLVSVIPSNTQTDQNDRNIAPQLLSLKHAIESLSVFTQPMPFFLLESGSESPFFYNVVLVGQIAHRVVYVKVIGRT